MSRRDLIVKFLGLEVGVTDKAGNLPIYINMFFINIFFCSKRLLIRREGFEQEKKKFKGNGGGG